MKVFIKSLLILSLLSGNISYADSKISDPSTLAEQQYYLEQLEIFRSDIVRKKHLLETYRALDGNVIRNVDTKKTAAILTPLVSAGSFVLGMKKKSFILFLGGLGGLMFSGPVISDYVEHRHLYSDSEFNEELDKMNDNEGRLCTLRSTKRSPK